MPNVRIFMSFDRDNDEDLHDLLLEQSRTQCSGFEISARSETAAMTDRWDERVRHQISQADEVIVICGEHTASSVRVKAELRIAQEEQKPYFLLWGRRERMRRQHVQLDVGYSAGSDRYDAPERPAPRGGGALQAGLTPIEARPADRAGRPAGQ
jgi:hypothetical protein